MSTEPIRPRPTRPSPRHLARVEYLDFQNVADCREYRLAVSGPDGPAEFRFRIAVAAFGTGRVRLQDGPDVCYQKLLAAVAAGETVSRDVVTIGDVELASYRDAHTPVPKRRAWTAGLPPTPPFVPRTKPSPRSPLPLVGEVELASDREAAPLPPRPPFVLRTRPGPRSPLPPVAALATSDTEAALHEGQRVSHAAFGVGVVTSARHGHTIVCFDEHGPRTFVTSMVELEVLSAPHKWETGPRGKNRPRKTTLVGN